MIFHATPLSGAYLIDLDPHTDERGFFARSFCVDEFEEHGLHPVVAQQNIGWTERRGTIRGMHFQTPGGAETKVVRCTRGAIHDVIVDLRGEPAGGFPTYAVELSEANRRSLYVPAGFAHGYQSLTDDSEVSYLMGEAYRPETQRGLRYDDPALDIQWPLPVTVISEKDQNWPLLTETRDIGRT